MGCEAGQCNKTYTLKGIFIAIPPLEGWSTKAKEAPSPPWGKTDPAGHQPSISMSKGWYLVPSA